MAALEGWIGVRGVRFGAPIDRLLVARVFVGVGEVVVGAWAGSARQSDVSRVCASSSIACCRL